MKYFLEHNTDIRQKSSDMCENIMSKFKDDVMNILKENIMNLEDRTGLTEKFFNYLLKPGYGINLSILTEVATGLGYKLEINFIKDENK